MAHDANKVLFFVWRIGSVVNVTVNVIVWLVQEQTPGTMWLEASKERLE